MINTLYLPELREMLAQHDQAGLRYFCEALHPARTADFMEGLEPAEAWTVLSAASPERRVEIFGFFSDEGQAALVESCQPDEMSPLIAAMPADDRVDLLQRVRDEVVEQVLPLLPDAERREILRLRQYPEGTAGSVMTTEVACLAESLTVREALEEIGRQSEHLETIYYIYIVDAENHLMGLVSARQLVANLGKASKTVADLMERDVVSVLATDDQEAVAEKVAEFDFLAIPVVDGERHLLGIITHDDVIDVLRREAEEDAYLAVAIGPLERSYLETPWYTLSWKRGVWLGVLSAAALMTVFALRSYEQSLAEVTWLALFLPLIISVGGNTGGQSATLVVTALTSGDLILQDWWRVIRREFLMGICLGAFLGALGYGYALLVISGASPDGSVPSNIDKLVIPITIVLVVLASTLCGGALPLLFRWMGLDPALMSTPFVAGIIDIAGILIYMTVASRMLGGL